MDYEVVMNSIIRIGMEAPDFEATTTSGKIKLSDYKGKWIVLFSHPADFTPVCTTEFIAFQKMIQYFTDRNTQLIGLSVDSISSHLAWLKNIEDNTNVKITFPLIADKDGSIARKYGMLSPFVSNTETVRNVFMIDDKQIVRTILIYPMNVGRYIPEIVRIIDALQLSDSQKIVTPANWVPGNQVIVPPPKTMSTIDSNINNKDNTCVDWYLCFRNSTSDKKIERN